MSDPLTVVVGSRELLGPLRGRQEVAGGSVRVFPPDDIRAALDTILSQRPHHVVLERDFARSPRGAAMVERLNADPQFSGTEILVVDGEAVAHLPPSGPIEPDSRRLDWRGTRRVTRARIAADIDVHVDGAEARLIDLSTLGAQVVSASALRPGQRVRVALPVEPVARMAAVVAWVSFELPKGRPAPQYRAGLEFLNPETASLERFCETHAEAAADPSRPA